MNEVVIFYGSKKKFNEIIPKKNYKHLTELLIEIDADSKIYKVQTSSESVPLNYDIKIENFIIESSEYAGAKEHVILNFVNFTQKFKIDNIYLHNPPVVLSDQVSMIYPQTKILNQPYNSIDKTLLKKFSYDYSNRILGQKIVEKHLLEALFPLISAKESSPIVILFYGDSGLGKTETVKYISELLEEKLFRKQFSMFQNQQFYTYLFGGAHFELSFARELLERESNIILLDEFDKANHTFYSAFYQLFDEGVFEDKNYYVEMKNSIIICTSNYKSELDIKKHLGNAIFSRFDSVIKFSELTNDVRQNICQIEIRNQLKNYSIDEQNTISSRNIDKQLIEVSTKCINAREIKRLVKNTFSTILLDEILKK